MMVTKGEIESICNKKYVDSTLCFEVLKPNPTIAKLDFTGLANFLINYTSRNVSDVLKEIKLYEGNTTDLQTIKLCEELYDLSLFSDDHALKALAARDYDSVNFKVGGTLENMVTCNEELSTMKPVPQSLIAKNNVIKNLSGIVLTILECFIRKGDVDTLSIEDLQLLVFSKPIRAPPFEPVPASQKWIKRKYNSNADGSVEIDTTPIIQRR
ncbi:hypothetical protein DY000_02038002 [Brassica cretica]|uniref:Pectinesterase inhibitor domain-containing protein n=1 Tax=Brassica cretica TaxID=69181 RepID=A0ABQ7BDS8_BRACR|nr:hypothetical protein DY000_02038002 [Brassica cretica]